MVSLDSGAHTLAFTLGGGDDGQILIDNVAIKCIR